MGVENAQMMWLRTPSYCYKTLTKAIRKTITTKGAQGLVEALSDIVAEYWTTYSDMHSRESADLQSCIQSWYMFQAMVRVLKDYGWWDKKHKLPINWNEEEPI